jgi:hydroxyethylthiazole kinase-like uncharacterized protein yjeF
MSEVQTIDGGVLHADWPLPDPTETESKHERGTLLVLGGAVTTPGAVILAGLAGLRVGAGRLSLATVQPAAAAMAVAVPEAAVTGLPESPSGGIAGSAAELCRQLTDAADAILFGPGMANPADTRQLVEAVLEEVPDDATIILDALAATCGVVDSEQLQSIASRVVITPNQDEAGYLLDGETPGSESDTARALADRVGVVAIAGSAVASPDGRCWRTAKGNSGLGTSGSGDVLAGAVAGLAARGATPLQAALWGVNLHSAAGDRLAHRVGPVGFLARELLDELPGILVRDPQ